MTVISKPREIVTRRAVARVAFGGAAPAFDNCRNRQFQKKGQTERQDPTRT